MIESIEFHNFKVLRDAKVPLGRFSLLVGPNGSGKSTVLSALSIPVLASSRCYSDVVSTGSSNAPVSVIFRLKIAAGSDLSANFEWRPGHPSGNLTNRTEQEQKALGAFFSGVRTYSLDSNLIAESAELRPAVELSREGRNLATVLDRIRDMDPERFRALNDEVGRLLPEYDQILFDTPSPGRRSILLRTSGGGHRIPAGDLSQGTLFALALLTLAYMPLPPPVIGLEEPDRGIHPRLLRDVRDALYRLSYPENYGEKREPVQVIATTHSPYMLDLYRDHPEEIIIAEKGPDGATFERLSDRSDLDEILADAHLGDVWYSGILGGVPAIR